MGPGDRVVFDPPRSHALIMGPDRPLPGESRGTVIRRVSGFTISVLWDGIDVEMYHGEDQLRKLSPIEIVAEAVFKEDMTPRQWPIV